MSDQTPREQLAALIDEHSFQAPSYSEEAADAVIAAGWRPPARVIRTPAEMASVPRRTVILSAGGSIACRYDETRGVVFGTDIPCRWSGLQLPAVVLYDPENGNDR